MRKLMFLVAVTALVLPAVALAVTPTGKDRVNGARDCRALKESMGADVFRATYGAARARGHNAFGKCVSIWAHTEAANRVNAARACRAERAADPDAFRATYGPRHAFGHCVSSAKRAERRADRRATLKAAHTCKAARAEDADAFAAEWGSGRRAFGKCVAATARAA